MKRHLLHLGLALCFGLSANAVRAQIYADSTYLAVNIDGRFNDWVGVPAVFYHDLPRIGGGSNNGRLDFKNVYVGNDENFLYIRFTLHEPLYVNWRFTLWVNGDVTSSEGFFAEGEPWKFRVIEGNGIQTVRAASAGNSNFVEGGLERMLYSYTTGTRDEVELRISFATLYGDATHPDGTENAYHQQRSFQTEEIAFRLTGNTVDDVSDSTGTIRYRRAPAP